MNETGFTIRGSFVENDKKTYYIVSGLEKQMLERKLRRMPTTEWVEWLRENGYTMPKIK